MLDRIMNINLVHLHISHKMVSIILKQLMQFILFTFGVKHDLDNEHLEFNKMKRKQFQNRELNPFDVKAEIVHLRPTQRSKDCEERDCFHVKGRPFWRDGQVPRFLECSTVSPVGRIGKVKLKNEISEWEIVVPNIYRGHVRSSLVGFITFPGVFDGAKQTSAIQAFRWCVFR